MRLSKSLLCGISALALGTSAAFAGGDSTVNGSVETSPPELLSEDTLATEMYSEPMTEEYALEEGDVLLVPSEPGELG